MNGHTEIVSLIKDNYTTNASQEHWNDEINRECSTWYDSWDDKKQVLQWVRIDPDGTTEVSPTPPPVEMQRVIALREMYGERKVVRRIHPGSLPSQQQLEYEKKKHLEEQRLQLLLMKSRSKIVEERCATKLHAHWRKHKATRLALLQRIKAAAATRLQRRFRFFNYSRKDIYALRGCPNQRKKS